MGAESRLPCPYCADSGPPGVARNELSSWWRIPTDSNKAPWSSSASNQGARMLGLPRQRLEKPAVIILKAFPKLLPHWTLSQGCTFFPPWFKSPRQEIRFSDGNLFRKWPPKKATYLHQFPLGTTMGPPSDPGMVSPSPFPEEEHGLAEESAKQMTERGRSHCNLQHKLTVATCVKGVGTNLIYISFLLVLVLTETGRGDMNSNSKVAANFFFC